eukprot:IDg17802t1
MTRYRFPRKSSQRLKYAVVTVDTGETVRSVSRRFHVPNSTLGDKFVLLRIAFRSRKQEGRPLALSKVEEQVVVNILCDFSDKRISLSRKHMTQEFAILILRMNPVRRAALPF